MNLRFACASDVGTYKERNEDSYYIPDGRQRDMAVVADGMGGYQAGDVASQMAVDVALHIVESERRARRRDEQIVLRAISEANRAILDYASGNEFYSGMGTTMIVALFHRGRVTLGHVGDSRAYIQNDLGFKRVTHDHSLVQQLMDDNRITEEEAAVHPYRNVILRAVGTEPDVQVDIYREEFAPGSRLLMCSDGLTRYLQDDEIRQYMAMEDIHDAVRIMMNLAVERGGADNITVLMVEHEEAVR